MHNYNVTRAMQGHADGLSALGAQAFAQGGLSAVTGMMGVLSNPNAQMNAFMYGNPVGNVRDSGRPSYGGGGGGSYYNQPYTDNSKHVQVALPDLFKPSALPSAAPMSFAPLSPGQIARSVSPAPMSPVPAAISFGTANAPMQASVPSVARQAAPPVNLVAQTPRVAEPQPALPPVSPMIERQSRPIEAPPMSSRYAPPPMAPMYGNPYARPMPAPPPPMMAPQFNPGQYMPNLMPERTFYQPAPPPRRDFLSRLGRGLQRAGESLNPNIAATSMARTKAEADVRMKAMEMDAGNWRNSADNITSVVREMMQQGGQDRRESFSQSNQNYRSELATAAQGRLTQSQGLETLSQAIGMVPQNQADYAMKGQMLQAASAALGQDFTPMINQTSTAGSEALMKRAIEMKRDALSLLKQENDFAMQPIENDIKRLQQTKAKIDVAQAPLDQRAKQLQIAKAEIDLNDSRDPIMKNAKRQQAIAQSEDWQRRTSQDAQQSVQREMQMGATMIGQANSVLMNASMSPDSVDPKAVADAKALMQRGQQLQQSAMNRYQNQAASQSTPVLAPAKPGQVLNEPAKFQAYLQQAGGDPTKAREMARGDGWIIPQLKTSNRVSNAPKIGMR
jgi:hypothetical protein